VSKGIDFRKDGDELLFRVQLLDGADAVVTAGPTSLYLYEVVMSDGTLNSYDFDDDTFKTGALTTETDAMTHRKGNNGTTDTGIWTYRLSTLTGFTLGNIYLAIVTNSNASPARQAREFQYGQAEVDLISIGQLDVVNPSELTSPPAVDANLLLMLQWVFTVLRNKITTNKLTGVQELRNGAGDAVVGTAAVTATTNVFTREGYV
jgi:hypothetical protein